MSSKRNLRARRCTHKKRFSTQAEALAAIQGMRRAGKLRSPGGDGGSATQIYRCSFCGHFHFGHSSQ